MSTFQVRIHSLGDSSASQMATFRLFRELGMRDLTGLTEYIAAQMPCLLVAGIDEDVADAILERLTQAGATVEKELSPASSPMLLCPQANLKLHWDVDQQP